ncbi:MAG: 50S ribosomal protein L11 methyltransferase [Thermoplasmata archaeon]|nr:50S ribosomal protein L11 methyltransferase [Thermoplasmata archaeon]
MKHSELVRALATVSEFHEPRADLEQLSVSPEAAAQLLELALARDDLMDRSVLDLGSGTGRLAIGSALLGASPVVGIEIDPGPVAVARESGERLGVTVDFVEQGVEGCTQRAQTVVMNPPFGAQRAHADRPFWEAAFSLADRAVYAFALEPSRSFIERRAVAHSARVVERRPVRWRLARTLPHHRKPAREVAVDLYAFETGRER